MSDRSTSYADLEIRILVREGDRYPVEMEVNHSRQYPRGYLDAITQPPILGDQNYADAAYGTTLFRWFLNDRQLLENWAGIRDEYPLRRMRLRIDEGAHELDSVPWEALCDPDTTGGELAAAGATPFSRFLAIKRTAGTPVEGQTFKVLVAIASPDDLPDFHLAPLDRDAEWSAIQQAMANQPVNLVLLEGPCTLAAIEAGLRGGCHALHFVGHGAMRKGATALFLADEQNEVCRTTSTEFAAMVARVANQAGGRLRVVFLSSCQSAAVDQASAYRGMAQELVHAGVPAVMAMQDLVPIETARAFATTFYLRLLVHGQVDLAANEARATLLTARLPGAVIPVLFSRLIDGQLLAESAPDVPSRIVSELHSATVTGGGAVAQGGSTAAGAGGVAVGGNVYGNIIINAGGQTTQQKQPDGPAAGASRATGLVKLTGPQFKRFQDALLEAFTMETLSAMVTLYLEKNLAAIAGGSNLSAVVFALIDWAKRSGQLDALLDGALSAEPGNAGLQDLDRTLRG